MPKISKLNLRQLFAKGMKPAQEAFYNLFDSYWHKDDQIDITAVKDLQLSLDNKLDNAAKDSLLGAFNDALTDIHKIVESDFKGVISPTGPVPTESGMYKPTISSEDDKPSDPNSTADWGKKYPNANNLRAKDGYDTMFYFNGVSWSKSETKILNSINDINNSKRVLKSFIDPKYTLDLTFNINDPSHYTIYGVAYWFGRQLKSDNSAVAKTGAGQYYNIWRNISTTQGTKKIGKLVLKVTPYTNTSTDVLKNTTLLGIKNGVVTPLVVGTSETVPNALQTFEIDVEQYDFISIGLYVFDANPVTASQTLEFYTVDRTIEEDGVKKFIEEKIGGSGGSRPGFIDLIDYGCAGDGETDDTDKINAAILELINYGGGIIYGRDRKFKVSSIAIPDVKKWCRIGIMGSIAPAPRFGTVGDFDVKTYNGMEIISSMNNTSKGIINVNAGTGFGGFNIVTLDIQKVTIRAYNNPQCHGINATNAAQLNIEDVIVDTGVYNVNASLPTAITAGILPPKLSNGAWTTYKNTVVCGFYSGVYVYEHTKADNLVLASNKIGLRFYKANHSSLFTRTGFYRNQKDIVVEDFHRFEVQQMAVELVGETQYNENNKWQRSVYNLEDIGNKGSGKITYDVCLGGFGPVDTFTKNGGSGVICTKL
ncbi:hypothetical protein HX126_21050 [Chryseobacterium indologenes]|uniref:hypothetical protein n=1 Tax=Chryseobacterium TaxID=59732 RepID=UPI001629F803|nr:MULTISPECIES: hypothetical protein [Chryseobacterium]MDM1557046.1 hypothetical protein [Chryseobacterium indologenes]